MKRKPIIFALAAIAAAAAVIPAYAHQAHRQAAVGTLADTSAASGTAEVTMLVHFNGTDTVIYKIEIPANDLNDARSRFFHDHVVDGVYQFTERVNDKDHLYLIERSQVVQTDINMK